tara:strand:- start:9972 stop:10406 length:435 start_codon:yes stop_codon:yes gene_type:complete
MILQKIPSLNLLLLDTHIWLWWLLGSNRLDAKTIDILDNRALNQEIIISIMNIWELEILVRKRKVNLNLSFDDWVQQSANSQSFQIIPLTLPIILGQRLLPESFHQDPADKLITSTAIVSGYELATRDKLIIDSEACSIWNFKD